MKNSEKITAMWFMSLVMVLSIVALVVMIYQDFGAHLYERWGHELAAQLESFSNGTAGR